MPVCFRYDVYEQNLDKFWIWGWGLRLCCVACRILVPQPGIKPMPSTVEGPSLNHWTTKEVLSPCYPTVSFLFSLLIISSSPVTFLLIPPQFSHHVQKPGSQSIRGCGADGPDLWFLTRWGGGWRVNKT